MSSDTSVPEVPPAGEAQEPPAPACVMSFNASDASGAGGLAGDVSTIAAMGAHVLPVTTAIVMRDTAEVFPSKAATALMASFTFAFASRSDSKPPTAARAVAQNTVPAHVRKSFAVKSWPIAFRT